VVLPVVLGVFKPLLNLLTLMNASDQHESECMDVMMRRTQGDDIFYASGMQNGLRQCSPLKGRAVEAWEIRARRRFFPRQ
jgi:hypothetical protein